MDDALPLGGRPAPAIEHLAGLLGTDDLVADEPAVSHRRWLAQIVQQGRQSDARRLRHSAVDGAQRVVPQILARNLVLGHAPLRRQLGCQVSEETGVEERPEPGGRQRGCEKLAHLRPDALARQVADELGARSDRGERGRLDREVECRRQPDRPDHPQRVLTEPRRGVADRPERARREVGPAVVRVDEPRLAAWFRTPRHRVDREVATRQVHLDRVAELDSMGPPVVGVVVVGTEGRDLDVADCSVTAPDRDGPELVLVDGPREQARRDLGESRGGQVPVRRRAPLEQIAQGPADHVRGVTFGPECPEEVVDGGGDRRGWIHRGSSRVERQFRPRKRYDRHASLRSSARYGVNSE